ncbi:hypothetical protein L914_14686 [Phytophthora nicotianae]|uniref:Uncharacterized protein n=1 Tax=Phytophthora nicotianae TaxID=4792 RepID=W2MRZ1_PHYNI|nr:hypothetical protein L914_14686 [Phytophthora nicotianae]
MGERCVGRFHTPTHCCLCYIISLDDARAPGFDKACVHDDDGESEEVHGACASRYGSIGAQDVVK